MYNIRFIEVISWFVNEAIIDIKSKDNENINNHHQSY